MPKGISDFREEGINERVAATRLEFFTKRRHQALAIIQLRMNEQKKLEKALRHKPQTQPDNGPFLGWPAILPQSRGSNQMLASTRLNSNGVSMLQSQKPSRASLHAGQNKREQLIMKHTSAASSRYQNILDKANSFLSP